MKTVFVDTSGFYACLARQLRAENAQLGLLLILGEKGHVRLVRAR